MIEEFKQRLVAFFTRRRTNFRQTFGNPWGKQALADLQEFCCANRTTASSNDPIELAIREGRRQVWLRIDRAINLTPEQQVELVNQKDRP